MSSTLHIRAVTGKVPSHLWHISVDAFQPTVFFWPCLLLLLFLLVVVVMMMIMMMTVLVWWW